MSQTRMNVLILPERYMSWIVGCGSSLFICRPESCDTISCIQLQIRVTGAQTMAPNYYLKWNQPLRGGGRIMLLRGGVFCMKWGEFVSFRCTFVGNRELNVIKTCKIRNQVDRSLQILKISYYDKITKSMLHIHSITSLEERFCYRHFFRLFGGILLL